MAKTQLLEKLHNLKAEIEKIEHEFVPESKINEVNHILSEAKEALTRKVDMLETKTYEKTDLLSKLSEVAEFLEEEVA